MLNEVDMLVIGGGVNGVGVARDAAGRGLKVLLLEQGDLASATSSASSKLIHGGLRYLENYEFRLVRESLMERERLWKIAPHLITPMRFVLPHHRGLRPAFILRAGLFLYDHIGGRKLLPATKRLKLKHHQAGAPLVDSFRLGFEYSDCWVDDARLVVANALGAQALGAEVLTRHKVVGAEAKNGFWSVSVKTENGDVSKVRARMLVNAAGPWVSKMIDACNLPERGDSAVRLVKGSHIVVPKTFDHDKAYTFQNADGRVMFAIPYEGNYTLIGTTDTPFEGDPYSAQADAQEVEYLCAAATEYFKVPIKHDQVVWHYSGVRPLYDDGAKSASKATRDYVLEVSEAEGGAPVISIFGGKITTYRRLAEEVMEKLEPYADFARSGWTEDKPLPGGDLLGRARPDDALTSHLNKMKSAYSWLDKNTLERLACAYGTRMADLMGEAASIRDMGRDFGAGLYEREVEFLCTTEWAKSADDILWRRTKRGLHMSAADRASFEDWFAARG